MAINDAALRQVVWRKLDVYAVAGKNSDSTTTHSPGNMSEDDVAVVKFDRECRTREDLLDATAYLDGALFDVLSNVGFRLALTSSSNSTTSGYGNTP
jgi:hypothetical protein